MSNDVALRRLPKQQRSQQRVEHILDAAASVFQEVGYDATTTNAIAARAGVSIGSLYQFFPNKEALRDALIARFVTGFREIMTISPSQPLSSIIDMLLNRLLRFEQENAGFNELFVNADLALQIESEMVSYVARMLALHTPALSPAQCHDSALICVSAVKGIMRLIGRGLPIDMLHTEAKLMLLGYFRGVLAREGIVLSDDFQ